MESARLIGGTEDAYGTLDEPRPLAAGTTAGR